VIGRLVDVRAVQMERREREWKEQEINPPARSESKIRQV
jgi:hypothetical protein